MNPITRKPRAYGPLHLAVSIFPDSDGTSPFSLSWSLSLSLSTLFPPFIFPRAMSALCCTLRTIDSTQRTGTAALFPDTAASYRAYVSRPFVSRRFSVSPSIPLPLLFIPTASADAVAADAAAAAATTDDSAL